MPNFTNDISTCLSRSAKSIPLKIIFMIGSAGLNAYTLSMTAQLIEIKRVNDACTEAAISASSVLLLGMILVDLGLLPELKDINNAPNEEEAMRYNHILGGVYLLAWMALTIPANAGAALLIKDPEGWERAATIQTYGMIIQASFIFLITTFFAIKKSLDACCSMHDTSRIRVFPAANYLQSQSRQPNFIIHVPEERQNQNQDDDQVYEFSA